MSENAPSWSWASVEGPVKFGFTTEVYGRTRIPNHRLRFQQCEVIPRGFNTTGEVEYGIMQATGPAIRCFLTLETQVGPAREAKYSLIPLYPAIEEATVQMGLSIDTPLEALEIATGIGTVATTLNRCKHNNEQSVGGEVVCLLLYHLINQETTFVREFLVLGLTSKVRLGHTTWQRLGLLSLESDLPAARWWFGELPEVSLVIA